MDQPTSDQQAKICDEVTKAVHNTLDCATDRGDWYVQGLDDRSLSLGARDKTQFRLYLEGSSGTEEEDNYEEFTDLLTVSVTFERRRKLVED